MNGQLYTMLEQLAAKLGVAVEMLWEASLKQVIVGGYMDIAFAILSFLVSIGGIVLLVVCARDDDLGYRLGDAKIVIGLVSSIALLLAFCLLASGLMGLLTPEYYAFQNIVGKIKP